MALQECIGDSFDTREWISDFVREIRGSQFCIRSFGANYQNRRDSRRTLVAHT